MAQKPITPDLSEPLTHQRTAKVEVRIHQQKVDLLPHEQDESATSQASEPRKIMKQASADIKRGLVDTDRGVPAGKAYAKQKV